MEMQFAFWEVWTEFLNIIQMNFSLQMVKDIWNGKYLAVPKEFL